MNNIDLVFNPDGSAGLTKRGVSQVLGVSYAAITEVIRSEVLFTPDEAGVISRHGVRGDELKKLCAYFQRRRVTSAAKQRCKELLATVKDFQFFISDLVGSGEEPEAEPRQVEQLALLVDEELPPVQEEYKPEAIDFIFGSDGHAGLSRRKAADLLKVSHYSVNEAIKGGSLFALGELETIAVQGLRGGSLVRLASHFAQSRQTSEETKLHCTGLLEKAAIIGIQTFIDRMAGIPEQQPALPPKPTAGERLDVIERCAALLDRFGGLDDRTKLAINDSVRNIAFEDRLAITSAPSERLEWPISDRVACLGYPKQPRETLKSIGTVASRLYVQRHGRKPGKREQFVDGTTREVNCYGSSDVDLLDKAIYSELGEPPNKVLRLPPPASR